MRFRLEATLHTPWALYPQNAPPFESYSVRSWSSLLSKCTSDGELLSTLRGLSTLKMRFRLEATLRTLGALDTQNALPFGSYSSDR